MHTGVVKAFDEAWQLDKGNCPKYNRWLHLTIILVVLPIYNGTLWIFAVLWKYQLILALISVFTPHAFVKYTRRTWQNDQKLLKMIKCGYDAC